MVNNSICIINDKPQYLFVKLKFLKSVLLSINIIVKNH